ncbi:unnamed protein product [Polarella glacialis]|uniref:Non-specific serine/threonine protein kinase n=1 Tax=Polarella glacialis TaxID=89957 RepID=A0A813K799_POLGL|nr:unnamed protein product [Polarella glacialis]
MQAPQDMAISQTQPFSQTQMFDPQIQPSTHGVHARLVSTISTFTFELKAEHKEITIGRHPGCQIQIKDRHVSSQHLRIYRDDSHRYFVEELGASGCWINELFMKKGEHRALTHGDAITIGESPDVTSSENKPFAAYIFRIAGRKSSEGGNDAAGEGSANARATASSTGAGAAGRPVAPADCRNWVTEQQLTADWDISHMLGSGNFSEVKLGVNVKRGEKCAVKIIDKKKFLQFQSKRESQLCLNDEADVLRSLRHPGIVQCADWFQTDAHLYLVMELVQGGDLLQCILENGCFLERQSKRLFRQLCETVDYLHNTMYIVHRDLKPENILLSNKDRETTQAKIADFGLARKNMKSRDCRTFCGTPHYFAPEVINTFRDRESGQQAGYGKQADMWSLGVILYILLSGTPPFEEEGLYEQITEGKYEFDVREWTTVTPEAKALVRSLMTVDPKHRLSIKQALDHTWLRYPVLGSPARLPAVPPCTNLSMFTPPPRLPQPAQPEGESSEPATKRRRSDVTMMTSSPSPKTMAV